MNIKLLRNAWSGKCVSWKSDRSDQIRFSWNTVDITWSKTIAKHQHREEENGICFLYVPVKTWKNNTLTAASIFQDELEFGYIDSPHQRFPVVLDSPRDGDLDNFPYDELLVREGRQMLREMLLDMDNPWQVHWLLYTDSLEWLMAVYCAEWIHSFSIRETGLTTFKKEK